MPNIFSPSDAFLSHKNNIIQKFRTVETENLRIVCNEIEARYYTYLQAIQEVDILSGNLAPSVAALGEYLDFAKLIEKQHSFFNWRSDFASSIIPEFIYRILGIAIHGIGVTPIFSTRNSVVEVSLNGGARGGWDLRKKNQDLCIGIRSEVISSAGVEQIFLIPLIVMEVKTNIDINKLNGLDFSAERMKRTFPSARYLLVTETIDFSLSANYASSSIDEIYTLRKQMRSQSRRLKEYLKHDVFERLQLDVLAMMRKASVNVGHVYERLDHGKLINVS